MIRKYLSGRMGETIPARTMVSSRPSGAIALLADDRKATCFCPPAERLLHALWDVGVDRFDVGLIAELGDHDERLEHLHHDLGRQRHVDRQLRGQPERE